VAQRDVGKKEADRKNGDGDDVYSFVAHGYSLPGFSRYVQGAKVT
jgi:hypothetical protein